MPFEFVHVLSSLYSFAFLVGILMPFANRIGKLCFETKMTKVYTKISLMISSKNDFIFSPAIYLIMCFMKASKNFGKILILKT